MACSVLGCVVTKLDISRLPVIDHYDDVVIGSSPLMLMQASLLARAGRSVCVVEREGRLGGSWKVGQLENGETVEIACHVIEFFPGVYDLLEGACGVPFEPLIEQPVRVYRLKYIFPYFSRILMIASGLRLLLGLISSWLGVVSRRNKDSERLINFREKFASYIKYQGPAFFQRPVMQGPTNGYVDFLEKLIDRCKSDGAEFVDLDVKSLERDESGRWVVKSVDAEAILAEHVHCTTSTNMHLVSPDRFEAAPQAYQRRVCVVVEVDKMEVLMSQTYVGFWADPLIARISRIDMLGVAGHQRFLVEFHDPDFVYSSDWEGAVRSHLEAARIIRCGGAFRFVGQVDCLFTKNVDQLPSGKIAENVWGYYSMGNLAAGLAAWQKRPRIPLLNRDKNNSTVVENV